MKTARFPIGLEFEYYGVKHNKKRVITDILTTTGSSGNVLRIEYAVSHEFMGQQIGETMNDTAIARSLGDRLVEFNREKINHAPGLYELMELIEIGAL